MLCCVLLASVNDNNGLKSFRSLMEEGLIVQDRSNESVDDAIASITENL